MLADEDRHVILCEATVKLNTLEIQKKSSASETKRNANQARNQILYVPKMKDKFAIGVNSEQTRAQIRIMDQQIS